MGTDKSKMEFLEVIYLFWLQSTCIGALKNRIFCRHVSKRPTKFYSFLGAGEGNHNQKAHFKAYFGYLQTGKIYVGMACILLSSS